jgi:hypothetical protein
MTEDSDRELLTANESAFKGTIPEAQAQGGCTSVGSGV